VVVWRSHSGVGSLRVRAIRSHRRMKQMKEREAGLERSIDSNQKKIDSLTQRNKAKTDEVAKVKRQMKNMEKDRHENIAKQEQALKEAIRHGRQLWRDLENGGNTIKWSADEYRCLFEYYKIIDGDFMAMLERDYGGQTDRRKLLLLLMNADKSDDFIMRVMNIQGASLRSLKSRINKSSQ